MRAWALLALVSLTPALAAAQSSSEVAVQPAAQPAAAPAAQPVAPAAEPEVPADERKGFDGRLVLDGSLRTLAPTRVFAGGVQAAVGGQIRHVAVHGEFGLEHGRTAFGLTTNRFHFGPSVEGIVDRVRFGGALNVVYSSFRRQTRSDSVGALALGLGAFALIDVARFDGGALVAGLRLDLDLLLGVQVGGALQAGVRF